MSATCVRASPAMIGPSTVRAIVWTASKSPGEVIGKPGLDHVDAQARELLGDLELLLRVQRDPGRLLAVTQRRVEDQYSVRIVRLGHGHSSVSLEIGFFSVLVRGYVRPPARYSPRRGRRRSRRSRQSAIARQFSIRPAPRKGRRTPLRLPWAPGAPARAGSRRPSCGDAGDRAQRRAARTRRAALLDRTAPLERRDERRQLRSVPAAEHEPGECARGDDSPVAGGDQHHRPRQAIQHDPDDERDRNRAREDEVRQGLTPVDAGLGRLAGHPVQRAPVRAVRDRLDTADHVRRRETDPHHLDAPHRPERPPLRLAAVAERIVEHEQPQFGDERVREQVLDALKRRRVQRQHPDAGERRHRDVDEGRERMQVEEERLRERETLAEAQALRLAPHHQANAVDRPGTALLDDVGHVLRAVLTDGTDDRDVAPAPPAPQRLDPGLEVLDEVPRREAADVLERPATPQESRSAREHRVGRVPGEHLAAVELRVEVAERIAAETWASFTV